MMHKVLCSFRCWGWVSCLWGIYLNSLN